MSIPEHPVAQPSVPAAAPRPVVPVRRARVQVVQSRVLALLEAARDRDLNGAHHPSREVEL